MAPQHVVPAKKNTLGITSSTSSISSGNSNKKKKKKNNNTLYRFTGSTFMERITITASLNANFPCILPRVGNIADAIDRPNLRVSIGSDFDSRPITVYLPVKYGGGKGERNGSGHEIVVLEDYDLTVDFGVVRPVVVDGEEMVARRGSGALKKLNDHSVMMFHLFTTDLDDNRRRCMVRYAYGAINLRELDVISQVSLGGVSPSVSVTLKNKIGDVCGNVKLSINHRPCANIYQMCLNWKNSVGVLDKDAVSTNGFLLMDNYVHAGVFEMMESGDGGGDDEKRGNEKMSENMATISSMYAERCYTWFSNNFKIVVPNSDRVNWYFNFSIDGNYLPLTFILHKRPVNNPQFFHNLFYYSVKKHLLRRQHISNDGKTLRTMTMDDICRLYMIHIAPDLKEKKVVMAQMITIIANAMRYVPDHCVDLKSLESIATEDFDSLFDSLSGDCEDDSQAIKIVYDMFVTCDFMGGGSDVSLVDQLVRELQLMAQCYTDFMCLDIVRAYSVSANSKGSGISAHMNVMLVPTIDFTRDVHVLDQEPRDSWQAEKLSQFRVALKQEEMKVRAISDELIEHKRKYGLPGPENYMSGMDVLVLEGTGAFYPLADFNKYQREYSSVMSKDSYVSSNVSEMIYHNSPQGSFFKYVMMGVTDRFAVRYDIPVSGFVFTEEAMSTRRSGLSSANNANKYRYGMSYEKLTQKHPSIRFIPYPFMTSNEYAMAKKQSKKQRPLPAFSIREDAFSLVKDRYHNYGTVEHEPYGRIFELNGLVYDYHEKNASSKFGGDVVAPCFVSLRDGKYRVASELAKEDVLANVNRTASVLEHNDIYVYGGGKLPLVTSAVDSFKISPPALSRDQIAQDELRRRFFEVCERVSDIVNKSKESRTLKGTVSRGRESGVDRYVTLVYQIDSKVLVDQKFERSLTRLLLDNEKIERVNFYPEMPMPRVLCAIMIVSVSIN